MASTTKGATIFFKSLPRIPAVGKWGWQKVHAVLQKEPVEPTVVTSSVTGAASREGVNVPSHINLGDAIVVDQKKSIGSYVADLNGNRLLDLYSNDNSLPLGYNHSGLNTGLANENIALHLLQGTNAALTPSQSVLDVVDETFTAFAPQGLTEVNLNAQSENEANELALRAALSRYAQQNGTNGPLSVISFKGNSHGDSLGALSASSDQVINKIDLPAFNWTNLEFPSLKYPLVKNEKANRAEEERCLELVENAIKSARGRAPVGAIIVEPIQSNGDAYATPFFFRGLRHISRQYGVNIVADETQTNLSTGYNWAHQHWGEDVVPDFVTFGRRFQATGYFTSPEFRDNTANQLALGGSNIARAFVFQEVSKILAKDNLVAFSNDVGAFLRVHLVQLAAHYPDLVQNVRGLATMKAFDVKDTETRDHLVQVLRKAGIYTGPSGERGIKLRPALTFTQNHAQVFLDRLETSLKTISY